MVADIDPARADAVAGELPVPATGVGCDVTDRDAVERLADLAWERHGHVDLVANNAGVFPPFAPVLDLDEANARWVLDVNLMGVWFGCGVFGKRFVEQGTPAHILNTGSENSVGVPHTHAAMYTASKHAVLGLSDVLRRELPDFVGVSVLCPGMVETDLATAPRHRHDRFGGPAEDNPWLSLAGGMDPEAVGELAVDGVRRGDFVIMTHASVREIADQRAQDVTDAFDRARRAVKIFLAGATGVLGVRIVPLLVDGGHDVVGMTRSPAKTELLAELGATPVVGDVFDREHLIEVVVADRARPRDAPAHRSPRPPRDLGPTSTPPTPASAPKAPTTSSPRPAPRARRASSPRASPGPRRTPPPSSTSSGRCSTAAAWCSATASSTAPAPGSPTPTPCPTTDPGSASTTPRRRPSSTSPRPPASTPSSTDRCPRVRSAHGQVDTDGRSSRARRGHPRGRRHDRHHRSGGGDRHHGLRPDRDHRRRAHRRPHLPIRRRDRGGHGDITVDLAGHTITGSPSGNGVDVTSHDDVTVGGGNLAGFVTGVRVFQGSHATVHHLDITVAPGPLTSGIVLGDTQSATVTDDVVHGGGIGVLLASATGSTIARNQLDGPQQGVILDGAATTLVSQNRTDGSAAGIVIATGSTDTTVVDNVLSTGVSGIYVDPFANTGTTIRANTATDFASDGIFIDAGTSVTDIFDNLVERNNTGITVRTATTTLTANHSFDNTALGIDAIAGVTDGGGNQAAGNGDPRQCVGVVCTDPFTPLSPLSPLAPASIVGTPRFTG